MVIALMKAKGMVTIRELLEYEKIFNAIHKGKNYGKGPFSVDPSKKSKK